MQQVKIFCEQNVPELERKINDFIEKDKVSIIQLTATETVIDGESWSIVYLLVERSQNGRL